MSGDSTGAGAGVSPFSMDGGTPSQFSMPGGGIPQFQGGAQLLPAALGGPAGVAASPDWTQAVQQYGGGMTPANWQQMAGALGQVGGKLQAPPGPDPLPQAPAGARAANMGAMSFTPQQLSLLQPALGGSTVNSLLQMLAGANQGFRV